MLLLPILSLTLSALIVSVQGQELNFEFATVDDDNHGAIQPVTCTSKSPQCCWVVRSWQLMGKITTVSSTNSSACCSMTGVTCDSTDKVIKIDWNARRLKNKIPSEIGKLTSLQYLYLFYNQLSGSIPKEIGKLKSLRDLYLSTNQLNGSIPVAIGKLINLRRLDLSSNQLSGSIPAAIGKLINLQDLVLSGNQLSGSIPAAIGKLINLQDLVLSGNQLSGSIPAEIGKLINLQGLVLSSNQLSGSIPAAIGKLINLQGLRLGYTQLSGSIPAEIGNLTNLQYLDLSTNQLSGSIPAEIGKLTRVWMLDLSSNQLSGSIPAEIGNLTNLQYLYLNNNPSLSDAFKPRCGMKVYASNTAITLCGCATSVSAGFIFPPNGTSLACLATGPATPLTKRIQVFSQNIGGYRVTCNTDSNGNPYQDCLNAQAAFCDPTFISSNATRITYCKNAIDTMASVLSSYWRNVRIYCGQWSFDGKLGSWTSSNCIDANNALKANAYYLLPDNTRLYVTDQLIDSVNRGLWGNKVLNA